MDRASIRDERSEAFRGREIVMGGAAKPDLDPNPKPDWRRRESCERNVRSGMRRRLDSWKRLTLTLTLIGGGWTHGRD